MKKRKNIIDDLALRMRMEEATDEAIISLFAENVSDLEMGDLMGATLLWHAVFLNRSKVAEWLLEQGADVNTQDERGFSALHAAVQENHIAMVSFLLRKGADINIRDSYGNTPVFRTTPLTPPELLRMLLENGASVDLKNNFGVSCRDMYAAYPELTALFDEYKAINQTRF